MSRRASRHTTVSRAALRGSPARPAPPRSRPARLRGRRPADEVITESETSLLDVIDNLLSNGVVLNADLVLALANVDLVYVRLSALLCAADRLLPPRS